jgi:hypothetical protein
MSIVSDQTTIESMKKVWVTLCTTLADVAHDCAIGHCPFQGGLCQLCTDLRSALASLVQLGQAMLPGVLFLTLLPSRLVPTQPRLRAHVVVQDATLLV